MKPLFAVSPSLSAPGAETEQGQIERLSSIVSVPNLRNGKVFWGQAQQGINCIPSFSKLYFDMVDGRS